MTAAAAPAQQPDEPLGELLDIIPLPEPKPGTEESRFVAEPPAPLPAPVPAVAPGNVLPVDLPPSAATGKATHMEAGAELGEGEGEAGDTPLTEAGASTTADSGAEGDLDAVAAADAAWAARQEQRRAEINAVESPIVDRLNAEMAARAAAEGRRFAEEQAAFEQSLIEYEADRRRREAEHAAEMEAYARRVAREQAAHRARVEACLAGDRDACGE